MSSLLVAALSNEPPGRFGSEADANHQWNGPQPLKSIGDSVRPLIWALCNTLQDTRGEKLADDPAEVDICRKDWAKRNRADFRSVCAGQGLENTPRNTAKHETDEKHRSVLGEEDDEDEEVDGEQSSNHGLLVAETVGNVTVEKQTQELANKGTVRETGLPRCCDFVGAVGKWRAELSLEGRNSHQVGNEDYSYKYIVLSVQSELVDLPLSKPSIIMAVDSRMDHPTALG